MIRTFLTTASLAALVAVSGAPLLAQGEGTTSKPMSASAEFQQLEREVQAAIEKWQAEQMKAAEAMEDGGPALSMVPPVEPFVERAQSAVKRYEGTEDAVQFYIWLAQWGPSVDRDVGVDAIRTLLSKHVTSPGLMPLAPYIPQLGYIIEDEKERTAMLARLEKESPLPALRGWAMLGRLSSTIETADRESKEYTSAKSELLAAAKAADDSQLMGEIQGMIDLREKFGAGNTAPDIAGTDLDGVDFKLSDYKGKVIFLDFWGDW